MLTGILVWIGGLAGTWIARYKIPPNNWLFQLIRTLLGAVIDQIHPAQFKQMAVQAKETKLEEKAQARSALNASMLMSAVLLMLVPMTTINCGGTLQKQLNVAILAEKQAEKYEAELAKMVEDAIAMLPVDQRPAAEAKYKDIKTRLDTALATLETTLQNAALADSTSGLNLGQLLGNVTTLISDLASLVSVFAPAKSAEAQRVGLSAIQSHSRARLVLQ
jgi:hypothetical protein